MLEFKEENKLQAAFYLPHNGFYGCDNQLSVFLDDCYIPEMSKRGFQDSSDYFPG